MRLHWPTSVFALLLAATHTAYAQNADWPVYGGNTEIGRAHV